MHAHSTRECSEDPWVSRIDPERALDNLESDARSKLQHRISCSNQHRFSDFWSLWYPYLWMLLAVTGVCSDPGCFSSSRSMIRYQRLFCWSSPTNPGAAIGKELKCHFSISRHHVKNSKTWCLLFNIVDRSLWLQHMFLLSIHNIHLSTLKQLW